MLDSLAFEGVGSFRNHIEPDQFIYNSIFTIFGNIILGYLYVKFGNSFSDRKVLAKNFVIISLTTMVIITIVKSSLALSLGLVGALSIVRFRTAIKEPEELSYLFLIAFLIYQSFHLRLMKSLLHSQQLLKKYLRYLHQPRRSKS